MSEDNAFLGTGWSFPPEFRADTGDVLMVSDKQDIEQSLTILLSTRPGERVMQPDYGCGIQTMVFAELNLATITEIRALIEQAILYFEPRIELEKVSVDATDTLNGRLLILLEYTIITTNRRSNMVYPFFIMEGTLVDL
ncbi:GPW/gp25 family protein [Oceanospirillum sediminis]|uniref:GPW/gp25 family protein n=1 Tax=Oceanospirillum sediminis TaxID=2760088 RepID=A0A839ISL5_9GAMM|nr:GPW/gp25 family protein [Oceanospirillum sediminis]MBB1487166.1 GPW/gp25 family protein [Oceanospirillum sediminis]